MYNYNTERVNLKNPYEKAEVEKFLNGFDLILDYDVDYTVVIRENDTIKATCSKAGNVFKCFAVSEELRGEGITATLLSALNDRLFEEGMYHSFIFTKPDKAEIFSGLNYKALAEAEEAVLLENGMYSIQNALETMDNKYSLGTEEKGAIVMNCNPFTLGHRYLIEKASENCSQVVVFVVEEDKSVFPFRDRYSLVKKGTEDLKNVSVVPGGEYIISSATFPSYFIKEKNERLKTYTEIDARLFGKFFCKKFNITQRFVGTEPFCEVTDVYNDTLKNVLPEYKVIVKEIERKQVNGEAISASEVRKLIKLGKIDVLKNMLPEVTQDYLKTEKGKEIIAKLNGWI